MGLGFIGPFVVHRVYRSNLEALKNISSPMKFRVKLCQLAASVSLVAAGAIALSAGPAQAFVFKANFTEARSGSDAAKGDIFLESVTLEGDKVVSDFSLINAVTIRENSSTGAASADIGDLVETGTAEEDLTPEGAVAVLGNLNLNKIIDVEDSGSFVMDLHFEQATDKFFLFERGRNSRLNVQALDADGNTIGNVLELSSRNWEYAGFDIDTKEIGSAQQVGSLGISLMDLGVSTGPITALRLSSEGKSFNGPDFKLFGKIIFSRRTKRVPEPSVLLGMGVAAAGLLSVNRRNSQEQGA